MKKMYVEFTRELNPEEKKELLHKYAGCLFNLNDVINKGFEVIVELGNTNCKNDVISYYSQFGCKLTDI